MKHFLTISSLFYILATGAAYADCQDCKDTYWKDVEHGKSLAI